MPSTSFLYEPPNTHQEFQSLCLRLFREHWKAPDLQAFARSGHQQDGVDLLGSDEQGRLCGGQCKWHEFGKRLTKKEVLDEIKKAKRFRPRVDRYVIATTAKRDPHLQRLAATKTREHKWAGLFTVEISSWDDICELLNQYTDVRDIIYGGIGASQADSILREVVSLPEKLGSLAATSSSTITNQEVVVGAVSGSNVTINISQAATQSVQSEFDATAEIDEAAKYLEQGEPGIALVLLSRIERRDGHRLTPHAHFRIAANKAHAYSQQHEVKKAANAYLVAFQHERNTEQARCFEALAYHMLDDRQRANSLATQIRADFPESQRAMAVWLMSAPLDRPFAELEASIPTHHREKAEVALALARRAILGEDFEQAEKYTRLAIRDAPNWVEPMTELAEIILTTEQIMSGRRSSSQTQERLREAVSLFSKSIETTHSQIPPDHIARIRANRAVAYMLLGDRANAELDLITAHSEAPDDPEVTIRQLTIFPNSQDTNGRIETLQRLLQRDHPPQVALLLAELLADRNQQGDRREAITLLTGMIPEVAGQPLPFRSQYLDVLIRLHLLEEDPASARQVLNGSPESFVAPEARFAMLAEIERSASNEQSAVNASTQAMAAVTDATSPADNYRLARVLQGLKRYAEALSVWRRIITPTFVCKETYSLLECAQGCNDDDFVIEFCRELREHGHLDGKCIDLELATLAKRSPQAAIGVMQTILAGPIEEVLARYVRFRLSAAGLVAGKMDLIETNSNRLPAVSEVTPELGLAVVQLLLRGPQASNALEYAYELLRRFPDALDAHLAMIYSTGFGSGEMVHFPKPTVVEPGVAVRYRENGTANDEWWIIEDAEEPSLARRERSASDPVAKNIRGKLVGDQFTLRHTPLGERTATVLEISSKFEYRCRDCLANLERLFPDQHAIWSFQIPKTPSGEPDIPLLLEQLDQLNKQFEPIEKIYAKHHIPLFWFGTQTGRSVFEAIQFIVASKRLQLRCCHGTREDISAGEDAIRTAGAVVLDSSALATLFLLDEGSRLKGFPIQCVVAEQTIYDLRHMRLFTGPANQESMTIHKEGDHFVRQVVSPDVMEQIRQQVEQFIGLVESCCTIAPGPSLATLRPEARDELITFFGRAGLASAVLAAQPGRVLWTDDRVLANFACSELKVRRSWTQIVFRWLAQIGHVEANSASKVTLVLLQNNYTYTTVSPADILYAAEITNWDMDAAPLNAVLDRFAHEGSDLGGLYLLACSVIRDVWRRGLIAFKAEQLTLRILKRLDSRPGGRRVIIELLRNVDRIFGLDIAAAESVRVVVGGWLQSGGGIILP